MKKCPIWVRLLVALLAVIYMMAGLALAFFTAEIYHIVGVAVPKHLWLHDALGLMVAVGSCRLLYDAKKGLVGRIRIASFFYVTIYWGMSHLQLANCMPWYVDLIMIALWAAVYFGMPYEPPPSALPLSPISPPLPPLKLSEWNWRMKP